MALGKAFRETEVPFNREDYGIEWEWVNGRIIDKSSTVYPTEAEMSVNRPSEKIDHATFSDTKPLTGYTDPIYTGNSGTVRGWGKKI